MNQLRHKSQSPTTQKKLSSEDKPTEQTFMEHLVEVRNRLFWIALVLIVTSVIGLQLKDQVTAAIMQPLHGQKLVYLTPGGGFSFIFTVSLYFGALFTIPVAIYHLFRFFQPLMGKTSRKFIAGFLLVSTLLAIAGALFGYYVTIPAALNFLATFAGDAVTPNLTAESYLSFVVTYILGLALIFQLPLLLFIFDHIKPLKPGFLSSTQNYVIIGATVLAAVITPTPDAFNMAVVAVPIIVVYEIGAVTVFMRRKLKAKRQVVVPASSVDAADEPLTDIINELRRANSEAVSQRQQAAQQIPQPIAVAVPQSAARLVVSSPVEKPVPVPQVQALKPVQPTAAPRIRSMDGFRPARYATNVHIPARQVEPIKPAPRPVEASRGRSVDGFLTV